MSGIRRVLCLLCLCHKQNNNHNVLHHEDTPHFICNKFYLKCFSDCFLSFLSMCVSSFFYCIISWNVRCYLRNMLMHVNFKCYELSTISFNYLIFFFTRVNVCWRERCLYRGTGEEVSTSLLLNKHFYFVLNVTANVVSE